MVLLSVGFIGVLVLISHVMWGCVTAVVVGIAAALVIAGLWFAVPLVRRREINDPDLLSR